MRRHEARIDTRRGAPFLVASGPRHLPLLTLLEKHAMNTTKRLILAAASALGLAVAAVGPAAAGMAINHTEPLTGR